MRFYDLANHIGKWHTGDLEFKCEKCPFVSQRRITLEKHKSAHLENSAPESGPSRSPPLQIKQENLDDKFIDSFDEMSDRQCQSALKKFSELKRSYSDDETERRGKKPFVKLECEPPAKMKFSSADFAHYIKNDEGEKVRVYKCPECGKIVKCHKAIIGHYRTHTGQKPYKEMFLFFYFKNVS